MYRCLALKQIRQMAAMLGHAVEVKAVAGVPTEVAERVCNVFDEDVIRCAVEQRKLKTGVRLDKRPNLARTP